MEAVTYSRNLEYTGGDEAPYITCPAFFTLGTLAQALEFGPLHGLAKQYDIARYTSRASAMLHALLHLDPAANLLDSSQIPEIDVVWIRFFIVDNETERCTKSNWTQVFGARLAKWLANYVEDSRDNTHVVTSPSDEGRPAVWYVQRNADNLVYFVLAAYVQQELGHYPFLPYLQGLEVEGQPIVVSVRVFAFSCTTPKY